MSAGKEQNIARHDPCAAYYAIGSGCDLLWRFATRAAVAEQLPVRTFSKNVWCKATFVLTVVPLDEVTVDFSYGLESGELASPHGSPQRTGEYFRERQPSQSLAQPSRIILPALGEWEIREAGVLTRYGPGCFTVPGQVYDREGFAHT